MSNNKKTNEKTTTSNVAESKESRFKRLASARMKKLLAQFDLIANLAGANYGYSEKQIEQMQTAIKSKMNDTFTLFVPKASKEDVTFEFQD